MTDDANSPSVAGILAYTIAFVVVIQCIELYVLQPLERRTSQRRR